MKKLFLLIWILILPGVVALAQDEETPPPPQPVAEAIYGLVTVDLADVRTGPDFAYPTIGQLPLNASVVVYGRSGDFFNRWDGRQWLQIDYGSSRAWIYARLLRTSIAFNSIPPIGRLLPRDANGRVPDVFDLAIDLCEQWPQGPYGQSAGDFYGGRQEIRVTYPGLPGANVYSVIVISPEGVRRAFDSETTEAVILLEDLPREEGTYTWRVAPYWTNSPVRYRWQQVCLLRTGGTIEVPPYDERSDEE